MPPDTFSRFLFRGNASGVGGRLRRPADVIWKVQGASSLPTIGGVSESKVSWAEFQNSKEYKQRGDFRDYVRFDTASTEARGDFVDQQAAVAMTYGTVEEGRIPTQTTVVASVTGAVVGNRLKIAKIASGLVADYPKPRRQPPIRPVGNTIEGASIDGYELAIELNEKVFADKATLRELSSAYEKDDAFYRKHRRHFLEIPGDKKTGLTRRAPKARGYLYCTVVSRIRWVGNPHPEAKIQDNVVAVPEFGRIYFGELLVSDSARRLTMVRIKLGSPEGGDLCMSEVETNGSTWPY